MTTRNGAPMRLDPKRVPKTADERQLLANQIVEGLVGNVTSLRKFFSDNLDPTKCIEDEIHVPKWGTPLAAEVLRRFYDRHPIAARVVECLPKHMWMVTPTVYELEKGTTPTAFETALDTLCNGLRGERSWFRPQEDEGNPLWKAILEWDILAGIGSFGALLIGLNDGLPLNEAARGIIETNSLPGGYEQGSDGKPVPIKVTANDANGRPYRYGLTTNAALTEGRKITYLRPFSEDCCRITKWEMNRSSPRYMQPTEYQFSFNDAASMAAGYGMPQDNLPVHWTRVLHLADNHHQPGGNPILAPPRMRPVFDELYGLQKLYGASPEGYWKMCFTLMSFEDIPQFQGDVQVSGTDIKDLWERVQNGLQRAWYASGVNAKPIAPTVVDATPHVNLAMEAITIKLNIPMRVFKGSERGSLASDQDDSERNDLLRERENNYGTPCCIVPVIDRFIFLGALPVPETEKYYVYWPDRATQTDTEKANVLAVKTQAYGTYVSSGMNAMVPEKRFMTEFDSMTAEEADATLAEAASAAEDGTPGDVLPMTTQPEPGQSPESQALAAAAEALTANIDVDDLTAAYSDYLGAL